MNQTSLITAIQAEERGDLEAAVAAYASVLEAQPDCIEALNNLGAICFRAGQPQDAVNFYLQALEYQPDFRLARLNLARTLSKLGQADASNAHYRALLAQENSLELLVERLQMLVTHGQLQQAASEAAAACAAQPTAAELWLVAGNAQLYLCQPAAAEAAYRKALSLQDSARARANLALALFAQSRFTEAWPYYEARHDNSLQAHDAVRFANYPWPRWQGEPLTGKRILLVGEQGLGDQIQFARFIEPLAASGAAVELVCHPALVSLLASTPGLQACHASVPPGEQFDFWSPLLSVPLHLGCEDALQCWSYPYLQADAAKRSQWCEQLAAWAGSKKKIGLVWRGSAGNATDRIRSIPTTEILELPRRLGEQAMFFSLHKDDATSGELELICRSGIIPLGDMLNDFSDTAALICELDLVVSVDTAVAHAAGALGHPLHVLLAAGIEWRWGQPGSDDCALYPSAHLHWKDCTTSTWAPLLATLGAELAQKLSAQNSST